MYITNKGKEWEKRNSVWILASLIAGSGTGLYWIGKKTGQKEWIELGDKHTIYAVIYVFLLWFFDASFFNTVALLLFARNMIKCIAHSLDIRAEALLRLEMLEDGVIKKIEIVENEKEDENKVSDK